MIGILSSPSREIKTKERVPYKITTLEDKQAQALYVARELISQIKEAHKTGKRLVFDMATGGSPRETYLAFHELVANGVITKEEMSALIIMGHENPTGTFPKQKLQHGWKKLDTESGLGDEENFDHYRRMFLVDLTFPDGSKIEVKDIVDLKTFEEKNIEGNFIPMNQLWDDLEYRQTIEEQAKVLVRGKDFLTPEGAIARNIINEQTKRAAQHYDQMLKALNNRKKEKGDIVFFGVYGVGTDGHINEIQNGELGRDSYFKSQDAYASHTMSDTSTLNGSFFFWLANPMQTESGFANHHNMIWERREIGEAEGRNEAQLGFGNIWSTFGVGHRQLMLLDKMVIIFDKEFSEVVNPFLENTKLGIEFSEIQKQIIENLKNPEELLRIRRQLKEEIEVNNNEPKKNNLRLIREYLNQILFLSDKTSTLDIAIEGSVSGDILDNRGNTVTTVERQKGDGEKIYGDLKAFMEKFITENPELGDIIKLKFKELEKVRESKAGKNLKCWVIFRTMVESINQWEEARQAEARINKTPYEPKFNAYNPVYMELSKFANLYIGRRSPVARIIRMRSMFGKETELVITRDVAKTSKFSKVYAKGKKA